jgi:hypothetical protein
MLRFPLFLFIIIFLSANARAADLDRGEWAGAADAKAPMTAAETRAFIQRLANYVLENHLKRTEGSPQRGLIYEYFRPKLKGQPGQWVQGEALDTMHDGAWFAVGMVSAARATGDPRYKEVLRKWQLPFYLKMLNHGDELFSSDRNDATPEHAKIWADAKEWLLQGREKGFVPYWWDDGASLSIEIVGRVLRKSADTKLDFPGCDELAGKPNPEGRLSGYSLGSSNHLAQDLGVMLQQTWLLFRDGDEADKKLAAEIAEAAMHLQECRTRHGSASIPAVIAAAGLANGRRELMKPMPADSWDNVRKAKNHFLDATVNFKPGQRYPAPGFADDIEYRYYSYLARNGTLSETIAWKTIFDAFTEAQLYRLYSDDAPVPPGIGPFDLHPYHFIDGKPVDLRSERKGPSKRPKPIGSRFGPQNMICCGWAIEALRAYPRLWERALAETGPEKLGMPVVEKANPKLPAGFWKTSAGVEQWLTRELGGGLRTWEAIFDQYGYIPTGLGTGSTLIGGAWDEFSDDGGYAHLIGAASQWLLVLEGKRDWEMHGVPK